MADFMDTKTNKHIVFGIVLSCLLVYTFSMCLKMVYSASMVEIKAEYGVPHSIASLPITLYYVFYAVIQLFLAAIIKKINMKLYMLITFTVSGLSFVTMIGKLKEKAKQIEIISIEDLVPQEHLVRKLEYAIDCTLFQYHDTNNFPSYIRKPIF